MNLCNTAICETKEGDLLIAWGGRRIVERCLLPPLIENPNDPFVERVWKRRYRWDNGNMIITRVYDNLSKRRDYVAFFGRNPDIIKDTTGRIWIGCRMPVISSQDPMGVLSKNYVEPKNIGTTAGMNFWQVLRGDNLGLLNYQYPFDWQEQVGIPIALFDDIAYPPESDNVNDLMQWLEDFNATGIGGSTATTMNMFTSWTEHRMTGDLMLRGMGGNIMDLDNPERWQWNEKEGLGRDYTTVLYDYSGRQKRYRVDGTILISHSDKWDSVLTSDIRPKENHGISGNIIDNRWGYAYIAGYKQDYPEIPYIVEYDGRITERLSDEKIEEYGNRWAIDNERKWVYENANVPSETYFSWEEPPSKEEKEGAEKSLAKYYYELPTLHEQRPAIAILSTGQIAMSWTHGNTTIIPIDAGKGHYKAVGMRMAISHNNGVSFEPLIPNRVGYLGGVQ